MQELERKERKHYTTTTYYLLTYIPFRSYTEQLMSCPTVRQKVNYDNDVISMTTSEQSEDSCDSSDTRCDNNLNVTHDTQDDEGSGDKKPFIVQVERPALTQEDFHALYGLRDGKLSGQQAYKNGWSSMRRSTRRRIRQLKSISLTKFLMSVVPILNWLPNYNWKRDLASDCAAGFTVAVMQVPQGLAYAILAGVPAIIGIYTAFFPVIIYILLGTSKHVSMGTFAVVSILTSKPIAERCPDLEDTECAVRVMSTVSFLTGFIMLSLGLLRLGSLSAFLTDPIVSGFTTGAGVHVFTSQAQRTIIKNPIQKINVNHFIFE